MTPDDDTLNATGACTHCGAVLDLARLVRVNVQGKYEYACQEYAVGRGAS